MYLYGRVFLFLIFLWKKKKEEIELYGKFHKLMTLASNITLASIDGKFFGFEDALILQ